MFKGLLNYLSDINVGDIRTCTPYCPRTGLGS
nr:MAG TPA: hypothetical protein [Caudoviricetes sp.]